jgi:hypothetical protein
MPWWPWSACDTFDASGGEKGLFQGQIPQTQNQTTSKTGIIYLFDEEAIIYLS